MIPNAALSELLGRVNAQSGATVYVTNYELSTWSDDLVAAMKITGLITKATPATSTLCTGCEHECIMPVHILSDKAAFVICDKRHDINRVLIPVNRLERWQTSGASIANLLARLFDLPLYDIHQSHHTQWTIGLLKSTKHASYLTLIFERTLMLSLAGYKVELTDVLIFDDGKITIDRHRLMRLVDKPIAGAGDAETAAQRRNRLQTQVDQLRSKNVRGFLKITAEREGISVSRLKQILAGE